MLPQPTLSPSPESLKKARWRGRTSILAVWQIVHLYQPEFDSRPLLVYHPIIWNQHTRMSWWSNMNPSKHNEQAA